MSPAQPWEHLCRRRCGNRESKTLQGRQRQASPRPGSGSSRRAGAHSGLHHRMQLRRRRRRWGRTRDAAPVTVSRGLATTEGTGTARNLLRPAVFASRFRALASKDFGKLPALAGWGARFVADAAGNGTRIRRLRRVPGHQRPPRCAYRGDGNTRELLRYWENGWIGLALTDTRHRHLGPGQ